MSSTSPGLTVDVYVHGTVGGVAVPNRMTVGPADVRTVSVPAHARDVDVVVTEYTGATGEVEHGPPALEPGQVQTTVADPPEDASPTVSKQVEVGLPQRAANSVVAAWQLRLAYRAVVLAAEQATAATGGGSVAIPLLGLDSGWTVQESRQAAHDVLDSIETTLRTIEISDGSSTAVVEDGEDDSSQKSIDSPPKDPKPSVPPGHTQTATRSVFGVGAQAPGGDVIEIARPRRSRRRRISSRTGWGGRSGGDKHPRWCRYPRRLMPQCPRWCSPRR